LDGVLATLKLIEHYYQISKYMKTNLFVMIMMCCFLHAAQVCADDTAYLPTVAYRDGRHVKIEYAYDVYGHIVSEKQYELRGAEYVSVSEQTIAYHQLPNGEFVTTKNEFVGQTDSDGDGIYDGIFGQRTTAAYDIGSVQLLEQSESYRDGEWKTNYRLEAILDANGVRTGVRSTGEEREDATFSFDSKGRTVRVASGGLEATYTWNDRDELTAFKYPAEMGENELVVMEARNIRSVYNGRYVNPYKFIPWRTQDWEYGPLYTPPLEYARNDYTLHFWLFDADVTLDGVPMTARSTVDEAGGGMRLAIMEGETVVWKYDFQTGENGSWTKTATIPGRTTVTAREYDSHGALIRYSYKNESNGNGYGWGYIREYDVAGRPVKTSDFSSYFDVEMAGYVYTYEAWTATGNEAVELPDISLSPNPATDGFRVDGLNGTAMLTLYGMSGQLILSRPICNGDYVSVTALPKGIYVARLTVDGRAVSRKIVVK
jgi:hypothetical protein